ncbi:unnamed protein product [Mytilus edulis]|uniref:Uncharacterized protein n=1 Tax=Mytilus edulis TaxID=6550 RepID=A0A8S3V147_MYTED|nr:unnamed protein product [Mytilus edulis]
MIEISEKFKVAINVLRDLHATTAKDLTLLITNMETLQKMKTEGLSSYTEEKQATQHQEKVLKDTIHEQSEKLLSQLDDRVNNMIKPLEAYENKTKENFRALELKSTFIKNSIASKDVMKVIKTAGKEKTEKEEIRSVDVTKCKGLPNFVPGCITQQTIASMYGRLEEKMCNTKFNLSRKFKTTFSTVTCMAFNNGSRWICNYSSKKIKHIKLLQDGSIIKKTINLSGVVRMQISNSGDTAAPLIINYAFHISKNNKIIVGAREDGPTFPPNGPRTIIV